MSTGSAIVAVAAALSVLWLGVRALRRRSPLQTCSALSPLLAFYNRRNLTLPDVVLLAAEQLPPPFASLLVHKTNMTRMLAMHHQADIGLQVLDREEDARTSALNRWILLRAKRTADSAAMSKSYESSTQAHTDDAKVVEFGSIKIFINKFAAPHCNSLTSLLCSLPKHVQADVRAGIRPFGSILLEAKVQQRLNPTAFFRVRLDDELHRLFELASSTQPAGASLPISPSAATWAFGRCNTIRDADGAVLAEVVEILPPIMASSLTFSAPAS